jgi:hypothetical protein
MEHHRHVYSFGELAELYRLGAERGEFVGPYHKKMQSSWTTATADSFHGGNSEELLGYLAHGYTPPSGTFTGVPVSFEGEGVAWKYNDEDGDYEHDLFISGEPDYYLDRRIVPSKPGIHVVVGMDFNGGVGPDVVAAYGEWVGGALFAIGSAGFDVSLSVTNTVTNGYSGEHEKTGKNYGRKDKSEFVVVVKRFGEVVIPKDFLILFSRVGFRHLIFLASVIEERHGLTADAGLGSPIRSDWGIDYDDDQRVLQVSSKSSGGRFPVETMDKQLRQTAEQF